MGAYYVEGEGLSTGYNSLLEKVGLGRNGHGCGRKPHREDLFPVQCNVGYRQATGCDVICPITLRIGGVKSEIILASGGNSKQNQRRRALYGFFDAITGIPLADGLYRRSGIRAMLTDLLTIALAL